MLPCLPPVIFHPRSRGQSSEQLSQPRPSCYNIQLEFCSLSEALRSRLFRTCKLGLSTSPLRIPSPRRRSSHRLLPPNWPQYLSLLRHPLFPFYERKIQAQISPHTFWHGDIRRASVRCRDYMFSVCDCGRSKCVCVQ